MKCGDSKIWTLSRKFGFSRTEKKLSDLISSALYIQQKFKRNMEESFHGSTEG